MAEAFFNHYGEGLMVAESAGLEKGTLNPRVVTVMAERGFDISNNQVNSVFEFFKDHRLYSYVITVCDEASGQKCPIFPGVRDMIHWSLEDPASFAGSEEEILEHTRIVRDQVEMRVKKLVEEIKNKHF